MPWTGRLLHRVGLDLARSFLDRVQAVVLLAITVAAVVLWPRQPVLAWMLVGGLGVVALSAAWESLRRRRRRARGPEPAGGPARRAGGARSREDPARQAWQALLIRAAIVGTLAVAAALGSWLATRPIEVLLPLAEVQRRVDARLPLEGGRGPLRYAIPAARVELRGDGRVGVEARFRGEAFGRGLDGSLRGSGRLDYRDGGLFLRDFVVEDFAADRGAPADPAEAAAQSASRLAALAREGASSAIGAALEHLPIHRLRDGETSADQAHLALTRITVRDGALVVTLDPLTGRTRLVILGLAAVAGLVVLLLLVTLLG